MKHTAPRRFTFLSEWYQNIKHSYFCSICRRARRGELLDGDA